MANVIFNSLSDFLLKDKSTFSLINILLGGFSYIILLESSIVLSFDSTNLFRVLVFFLLKNVLISKSLILSTNVSNIFLLAV